MGPHPAWTDVGRWVNTVKDPVASAICHAAAIWQFCPKIPRPHGNNCLGGQAAASCKKGPANKSSPGQDRKNKRRVPADRTTSRASIHLVWTSALAGEVREISGGRRWPTEINKAARLCGDAHCRVYHVD